MMNLEQKRLSLSPDPLCPEHSEFEIVNYNDAVEQADIVTFLVAHKQFKTLEIETDLDFCGVTNK